MVSQSSHGRRDADHRRRVSRRCRQYTNEELLEGLRAVFADRGKLTTDIIKEDPRTACPDVYKRRFGGLAATYALVGFTPSAEHQRLIDVIVPRGFGRGRIRRSNCLLSDEEILSRIRAVRDSEGRLTMELISVTPGIPGLKTLVARFGSMAHIYELVGHTPSPQQLLYLGRPKPRRIHARPDPGP